MKSLLLCLFRVVVALCCGSLVFAQTPEDDPFKSTVPPPPPSSKEAAAALQALKTAADKFVEARRKAEQEYFRTLADNIGRATRIELYELSSEKTERSGDGGIGLLEESEWFPIRPDQYIVQITKTKKLEAEDRTKVAAMIKDMILKPGKNHYLCHHPIHGLRAWIDDTMIFETSICYECENFYLAEANIFLQADWVPLPDTVKPILTKLMPLPEPKAEQPAPVPPEKKAGEK